MKKTVYALLALGTLLLAASCNKEPLESMNVGDEAVVTFSLQADAATKALSDGQSADKLIYAVYKEGTLVEGVGETLTGVTFPKQLQVKLAKGNTYQVVFFAQDADCTAYTLDATAKTLAVDYTKLDANKDTGDAFYAVDEVTVTGTINKNVTLKRPLAQINLGTDDYEAFAANNSLGTMSIDITGVPTTMNLLDGTLTNAVADYSVTGLTPMTTEKITVAGVDYTNLAMAYVLAGEKALTEVTYKINDATSTEIVNLTVSNLPFQRNYRTNVLGSFLTGGVNYTINIDNEFETPDYDAETVLQLALIRGGNVTLGQDYDLEHQLVVPPGVNVVLDLNGHTLSNTKDIWNEGAYAWSLISVQGGALTIKGEGELAAKENDCYAIDIRDGGNLVIEGGEYIGNITAVYALEGTVEIKGGEFDVKQLSDYGDKRYMLNCLDANYTNGTAKIIVSGGKFHGFDPSNNAAEGANTDFLADGYYSISDGDNYVVAVDTETPTTIPGVTQFASGKYKIYPEADKASALQDVINLISANPKENETILVADNTEVQWECVYSDTRTLIDASNSTTQKVTIKGGEGSSFRAIGNGVRGVQSGAGTISLMNLTLYDDTRYNAEDGNNAWEFAYLEWKGNIISENIVFADAIQIEGNDSETSFKKCTFIADGNAKRDANRQSNEYAIWICSGKNTFSNCTFTGFRGAKIHEAYGTDVTTVLFDTCTFKDIEKKPGIAIGTVDATTTISIKNCTFSNVQAGDQGNYKYETDTAITSFNFTDEGNTVN